ncbi:MAG: phage adaptor protein [Mesorhizobium sp.]
MAVFADALDLKTAVGDHVGNRSISDVWPRLVQQAETQLNQRLRTVWQVTDATITMTDGEGDLPSDFLEMIDVFGPCGYRMRAGLPSDLKRPGTSFATYSIGAGKLRIRGFGGDKAVSYYAALPTISGSLSASNWLLEQYGDCYLYGVGLQAAKYLKDVDLAQATDQLFGFAMQAVKIEDERQRWSNSVVRVAGMTP